MRTLQFLGPALTFASEFLVDGTAIPDVPYDVGESYAGQLPVGNSTTDDLFFWFFPSTNEDADQEILIWLNGGVSSQTSRSPLNIPH